MTLAYNKKVPPVQVAMGEPTTCTSGLFVSKFRAQDTQFWTSISTIGSGMQQQHATTTTTDQLRISMECTMQHSLQLV